MVEECICPECGRPYEDYYEDSEGLMFSDDDTVYVDYNCHCSCGCKFTYTEWFRMIATTTEKMY